MSDFINIATVSDFHNILEIDAPKHPLITIIRHESRNFKFRFGDNKYLNELYLIALRNSESGSIGYGRNSYDFDQGTMIFMKPGQVNTPGDVNPEKVNWAINGWTMVFHPDLLRKSVLFEKMESYSFFSYEVSEALHLSQEERQTITNLIDKIQLEINQTTDQHSQVIITSNIELILNYCHRFYDRQFYMRSNMNIGIISKFEKMLSEYFKSEKPKEIGIPTVTYCGTALNMTGHYLSDLLKKETGKTAQEHIHRYVISKAKNQLLNSDRSVSEIAYDLGFDYPQHFSKIFKSKTGESPTTYRKLS